jgi:hypothetical protein
MTKVTYELGDQRGQPMPTEKLHSRMKACSQMLACYNQQVPKLHDHRVQRNGLCFAPRALTRRRNPQRRPQEEYNTICVTIVGFVAPRYHSDLTCDTQFKVLGSLNQSNGKIVAANSRPSRSRRRSHHHRRRNNTMISHYPPPRCPHSLGESHHRCKFLAAEPTAQPHHLGMSPRVPCCRGIFMASRATTTNLTQAHKDTARSKPAWPRSSRHANRSHRG